MLNPVKVPQPSDPTELPTPNPDHNPTEIPRAYPNPIKPNWNTTESLHWREESSALVKIDNLRTG